MTQQTGGVGDRENLRAGLREGLYPALKNIIASVLTIGKTRVELLVVEVEEEKYRLMTLWAKAIGAAFFLALGIVMAVLCLVLVFWESRALVLGGVAVLFVVGGLALIVSLKRQAQRPSKLFHASLSELEADLALLRRHAKHPE